MADGDENGDEDLVDLGSTEKVGSDTVEFNPRSTQSMARFLPAAIGFAALVSAAFNFYQWRFNETLEGLYSTNLANLAAATSNYTGLAGTSESLRLRIEELQTDAANHQDQFEDLIKKRDLLQQEYDREKGKYESRVIGLEGKLTAHGDLTAKMQAHEAEVAAWKAGEPVRQAAQTTAVDTAVRAAKQELDNGWKLKEQAYEVGIQAAADNLDKAQMLASTNLASLVSAVESGDGSGLQGPTARAYTSIKTILDKAAEAAIPDDTTQPGKRTSPTTDVAGPIPLHQTAHWKSYWSIMNNYDDLTSIQDIQRWSEATSEGRQDKIMSEYVQGLLSGKYTPGFGRKKTEVSRIAAAKERLGQDYERGLADIEEKEVRMQRVLYNESTKPEGQGAWAEGKVLVTEIIKNWASAARDTLKKYRAVHEARLTKF